MKFFNTFFIYFAILCAGLNAQEESRIISNDNSSVVINFRNLEIVDFVKLVSNIMDKNILLQDPIPGKVEFISTIPINKKDLPIILQSVLASKGYTMINKGTYLEVVRNKDASQYNLPFVSANLDDYTQMVTGIIEVKGLNIDEVANKIRHLASTAAKFVTIKENNSLVITDFPENIETIKKIVASMEKNTIFDVVFIKISKIDVEQILPTIQGISQNIFNEKVENEKVMIYSNKADNGIIAVGSTANLNKLREIIKNLDKEQNSLRVVTKVIQLKNTEAKDIHKIVVELVSSQQSKIALEKPVISIDEVSNSIVVLSTQRDYETIQNIINELDKEQKQVFVKAKIVEISETASHKIGIKYGLEGGKATSSGLYSFAMNMGGPSVTLSPALGDIIKLADITSGLVLGASIDFLTANGAAKIVSEPSVLCVNNMESKIYVGQTQSIITSTTNTDSTTDLTRNTYSREDIGLTLQVKPRISNDGKVMLQIDAKVEDVLDGSGGSSGMPTTTKREVTTRAIVKHGESVIVGGLIRSKNTEYDSKVPLLGDIPLIGRLFTHTADINEQLNIVIILTPYIVDSSEDLSFLRAQLTELDRIQEIFSKTLKEKLEEKLIEEQKINANPQTINQSTNKHINNTGYQLFIKNYRKDM